jgi:carbon storage regulator CsrA
MLVLSRKAQQGIWIGDDVLVKILSVDQGRVKIGIEAPAGIHIDREELRAGKC